MQTHHFLYHFVCVLSFYLVSYSISFWEEQTKTKRKHIGRGAKKNDEQCEKKRNVKIWKWYMAARKLNEQVLFISCKPHDIRQCKVIFILLPSFFFGFMRYVFSSSSYDFFFRIFLRYLTSIDLNYVEKQRSGSFFTIETRFISLFFSSPFPWFWHKTTFSTFESFSNWICCNVGHIHIQHREKGERERHRKRKEER